MATRLLFLASLYTLVSAFSGTHPLVAWSSNPSKVLHSLSVSFETPGSPLHIALEHDDICIHDAVVIIEHPGVHASDLRSLSPPSSLIRHLSNQFTRNYPYVPAQSHVEIASTLAVVASQCNSRLVTYNPGTMATFDLHHKQMIHVKMPSLDASGEARRNSMAHHSEILSIELDNLKSIFPGHLIIYTGSPLIPGLTRRQAPGSDLADHPTMQLSDAPASAAPQQGGILHRYQLLTPGLISALLVVIFVLLPIVLFGASALADIKSPLKVESVKGYNAREKKLQ